LGSLSIFAALGMGVYPADKAVNRRHYHKVHIRPKLPFNLFGILRCGFTELDIRIFAAGLRSG
jgi:hypothetical protein